MIISDGNAISEEDEEEEEESSDEASTSEDPEESRSPDSESQRDTLPASDLPLIPPPPVPTADKGPNDLIRKGSMDIDDDEDLFENPVSKQAPLGSISEVNLFIEDAPLGQYSLSTDEVHV